MQFQLDNQKRIKFQLLYDRAVGLLLQAQPGSAWFSLITSHRPIFYYFFYNMTVKVRCALLLIMLTRCGIEQGPSFCFVCQWEVSPSDSSSSDIE